MRKYSINAHRISSPEVCNTVGLDYVFEVLKKLSVSESSTRCLDDA